MDLKKAQNKTVVLIVDDQRNNRQLIKLSLDGENYQFIEASDGLKAIDMCREHNPDIILMDAIMPKMDGFEATRFLREIEEFKRTPILMITILSNKEDRIKAIECGVNDFITKPFDKLELIARCKSYVNLSNINKKYILSTKNTYTNMPNKEALLSDLSFCDEPKLVLFRIEDYELIEEFYSDEIASMIELEFSKIIMESLIDECKNALLYHIGEGEFALLNDTPIVSKMWDNCNYFYNSVKNSVIYFEDIEYHIDIVLSYAYGSKQRLFEHARMGLNYAIKTNKNIVSANDVMQSVHKSAKENIKMVKELKSALKNGNIISHFQPIYNNKTKTIDKYESLVRIEQEEKILYPSSFLSVAKKGKYYNKISKEVLKNSFNALNNTNKNISINISISDLEDEDIKEYICSYLKENKDKGSRIIFELLEEDNSEEFDKAVRFIHMIKGFGVKIAIDDFGSGYSNFKRLLELQPDFLKIDGTLIKSIDKDPFSRNLVESIHNFSLKSDIKTIAEFVEDEKIFDIINEIGIDYTQGFYIGKAQENIQ